MIWARVLLMLAVCGCSVTETPTVRGRNDRLEASDATPERADALGRLQIFDSLEQYQTELALSSLEEFDDEGVAASTEIVNCALFSKAAVICNRYTDSNPGTNAPDLFKVVPPYEALPTSMYQMDEEAQDFYFDSVDIPDGFVNRLIRHDATIEPLNYSELFQSIWKITSLIDVARTVNGDTVFRDVLEWARAGETRYCRSDHEYCSTIREVSYGGMPVDEHLYALCAVAHGIAYTGLPQNCLVVAALKGERRFVRSIVGFERESGLGAGGAALLLFAGIDRIADLKNIWSSVFWRLGLDEQSTFLPTMMIGVGTSSERENRCGRTAYWKLEVIVTFGLPLSENEIIERVPVNLGVTYFENLRNTGDWHEAADQVPCIVREIKMRLTEHLAKICEAVHVEYEDGELPSVIGSQNIVYRCIQES